MTYSGNIGLKQIFIQKQNNQIPKYSLMVILIIEYNAHSFWFASQHF